MTVALLVIAVLVLANIARIADASRFEVRSPKSRLVAWCALLVVVSLGAVSTAV